MQTTSIRSWAARSASWSSVVMASPDATVCRWQSTRTQPARTERLSRGRRTSGHPPAGSRLQRLERAPGAVYDPWTENVGVGRCGSHRVGRVADEHAFEDARELP